MTIIQINNRFSYHLLTCAPSHYYQMTGAFWLKSEPTLTNIRTANFEIRSLGRAKRKGVGGKESRVVARDKLLLACFPSRSLSQKEKPTTRIPPN